MTTDPKSATPKKSPHYPAAFINALSEEGSRHELILHLQETWNDYMEAKRELSDCRAELDALKREFHTRVAGELERLRDRMRIKQVIARGEHDELLLILDVSLDGIVIVSAPRLTSHAEREGYEPTLKASDYHDDYREADRPAPSAASGLAQLLRDIQSNAAIGEPEWESINQRIEAMLRSHQAPVGEDAAHSFSAAETDRFLLGAYTPTSYPYGYPWYLNLTMLRMAGDVVLTVRASPSAWGKDANASSVRFTREMWREFAKLFESANKVYEAADSLDSEAL